MESIAELRRVGSLSSAKDVDDLSVEVWWYGVYNQLPLIVDVCCGYLNS